ncbi:hypothetical protein C8A03DRAFT_11922 [Achaetomium macrosporum]|uniref:C-type lectin domain-containing protein n=1 Tax=Achaetomium macrosporum TaxID=79813 RepID=A0AAN7CHF3_9PEZI|nr:hypothetical protein C8A03DRAFT_11922 [Achaetomium macrosporum]
MHRRLLAFLLLVPGALTQPSALVVVVHTPQTWQDALAHCQEMGHIMYPVPATPTDPIYNVLEQQPGENYWISRRTGGSCTCLDKNGVGDLLEELPCGDLLPAFCLA